MAFGEILALAAAVIGVVTVAGWLAGREAAKEKHSVVYNCWIDRRYGEMCQPADRSPVRRHKGSD